MKRDIKILAIGYGNQIGSTIKTELMQFMTDDQELAILDPNFELKEILQNSDRILDIRMVDYTTCPDFIAEETRENTTYNPPTYQTYCKISGAKRPLLYPAETCKRCIKNRLKKIGAKVHE